MLKEKIEAELKEALKKGDQLRLSVLRMLSSAIHNKEIENRTRSGKAQEVQLSEEEVIQVIRSELKKRRDAVEAYRRGGRDDAAAREQAEADFLNSLLPSELSDAELEQIVAEGISALGVASEKEFGKLMGWVMARIKGQASGERVSAIARRCLAGS